MQSKIINDQHGYAPTDEMVSNFRAMLEQCLALILLECPHIP